jgi:MoxR-like ATPase
MFESVDQVLEALAKEQYIGDKKIATVVFLAQKLEKPVLIEGPAGVGKTELAKVVARATGRHLIRLQCYEGLDEAKALYEWEYSKQLLYTQILKEKFTEAMAGAGSLREAAERVGREDSVFFSNNFIVARPLLTAITSDDPALLLIDEVDKSDPEFEAFLLEVLSDFQITIPEIGTITARRRPAVILTSNRTRELHDALKRRALFHWIGHPSVEREIEIVRLRVPGIPARLAAEAAAFVRELRGLDLAKPPGVAETIDWAMALNALGRRELDAAVVEQTLGSVLKYREDIDAVRDETLARLVDEARAAAAP